MSDTTFTDNPLWSTETVRKLITILLPHRGEKFDRWYSHEINKAYQRGHDSYKEFVESTDPYERYQYLTPPPATEFLPEVIDQDNVKLFDDPRVREHIWQDGSDDYWYWVEDCNSWDWTESIELARALGARYDLDYVRGNSRPFDLAAPFTRVERVS